MQVQALVKKAGRKAALEKLLKEAFVTCLVGPFVEAAAQGRRRSCTALTQSWLVYLATSQVTRSMCKVAQEHTNTLINSSFGACVCSLTGAISCLLRQ